MPTPDHQVTLNNGVAMPILGFGVYQIPPEQTEQAVTDALAAGYRHLDTAAAYGNEEAVGRARGPVGSTAMSCSSPPSCGSRTHRSRTTQALLNRQPPGSSWAGPTAF